MNTVRSPASGWLPAVALLCLAAAPPTPIPASLHARASNRNLFLSMACSQFATDEGCCTLAATEGFRVATHGFSTLFGKGKSTMAKKATKSGLSGNQIIAWGLLRKAMEESGLSRDKLPTTTWRKLTKDFNAKTGESLSVDDFRALAIGVDKMGVTKVGQLLQAVGLSRTTKS